MDKRLTTLARSSLPLVGLIALFMPLGIGRNFADAALAGPGSTSADAGNQSGRPAARSFGTHAGRVFRREFTRTGFSVTRRQSGKFRSGFEPRITPNAGRLGAGPRRCGVVASGRQ